MVRFLYRGDIHDSAVYLNQKPEIVNLALTGSLAGPWDRQAFLADVKTPVVDRWFDPTRTILFPTNDGYVVMTDFPELAQELEPFFVEAAEPICENRQFGIYRVEHITLEPNISGASFPVAFENGLSLKGMMLIDGGIVSSWQADGVPNNLPLFQLVSNPPPPGVDVRPRLSVFVHFLNGEDSVVSIDDGLWVDPYTLQPGDSWLQFNHMAEIDKTVAVELGLYDPVSGERIPTIDGQTQLLVKLTAQ
jgi:hypothetical protein